MAPFHRLMRYYPSVFHPVSVLGGSFLVLIYHEWTLHDDGRSALWPLIGAFLGAGRLSLVPTAVYVDVSGSDPLQVTRGNDWEVDALVGSGLFLVARADW